MVFECVLQTESGKETWNSLITTFSRYGSHYEMRIESRSVLLVLFGKTSYGYFACIADFGAGCHIASLKDRFWNNEKLSRVLGSVDGFTVAQALYVIADRITEY